MNAKDKLAAGRLVAVRRMPYYRAALNSLVPHPMPGLGTFAVSRRLVMLYDPAVVEEWSVETIAAVLVHEINHPMRSHHDRCERVHAEPETWNVAADLEINDDIRRATLRLPGGAMFADRFGLTEGLTAEEYYRKLLDQREQERQKPKGDQKSDDSSEPNSKSVDAGRGIGNGSCGGAAGNPLPCEAEIDEQVGRSDRAVSQTRRTVAEAVRAYAASGKGDVPGGLVRWSDSQLASPKIPWRQKLSRLVRVASAHKAGAVDLSYDRPSRRQAGVGYGAGRPVMHAFRAPVPRVALIVDTSGSMGSGEIDRAVAETSGVLRATGGDVQFVACDTETHGVHKVRTWTQLRKLLEGGGGTDLRPAFKALEETRERPDVVICITDGWIGNDYPAKAPAMARVIWVVVGSCSFTPRWGEVVKIEEARP